MANEFTARNGLIAQKDSIISGSLTVPEIIGSGTTSLLTLDGTFNAVVGLGRGVYVAPTINATANSDKLGALTISPIFTTGGYTGVNLYDIWITGGGQNGSLSSYRGIYCNPNATAVQMVLKTNSGIEGGFWTNGTTFSMGTNTNYPLNFIVASSNKGIIQTNGNWGIGTIIDAGYKLDVNGNTRLFGDASVSGSLAVNYPSLASIYKLGVGGSAVVKGSIVIQDDSGAFVAYSTDGLTPAGGFLFNQYVGATIYSSNANPLKFSVNNAEALRVFNGGNISIGSTTNAGFKLDVNGTTRLNGNTQITGSINQGGVITTSSTIARGAYLKPTLSASANFDSLIGLDIQPNFVTSSYTQISPVGLRVTNPGGGIITIGQNKDFSFVNEILCTGRLDFGSTSSQLSMRGTQIYFSGPTVLTRTADASSTATQRNSYSFPMQAALWNGSAQSLIQSGFAHKASTTVNLASRLAAIVNTTSTDLNTSGTEALTIFSPSANVLLAASGSTTFTDSGHRLDVQGTSRFNGNMNITGSQYSLYFNYIYNPNAVATAAAKVQLVNAAGNTSAFSIASDSDATDPSMLSVGGSNKGIEFSSNSVRAFKIFDSTRNVIIQSGGTFTDAGYRLDVVGTSRFNGNKLITGSLGMLDGNLTLNTSSLAPAGGWRDSPSILTYGSTWNSAIGPVAMNGGFKITPSTSPTGFNTNPTIAKLSFLVGTDNSASIERMSVSSQGKLGINGGALFSAPSSSNTYNVTMTTDLAATPSLAVNSNKLILKGNAWNNAQGSMPNMGYLRMSTVTNNVNPTIDKLSFFVGSADNVNNGDVDGNAIERLSLRTDGLMAASGSFELTGTPLTDAATLTGEQLSTGTGTNWSGTNFTSGYTHTVGSTTPLVATLGAIIGAYYQYTITISGRTAGSIGVVFGTSTTGFDVNGTSIIGFRSGATTPVFTVTPTTNFDGTVVASVKYVTAVMPAISTYKTSTGVNTLEIRSNTNVQNTFIGVNSGRFNTTGSLNTVLGHNALPNNIVGTGNTVVGTVAGVTNTQGNYNTYLGNAAGYLNASGSHNVCLGNSAGFGSTGTGNTFVGSSAGGGSNVNGPNTAIGYAALNLTTTGASNDAYGYTSLYSNTIGSYNVGIGREAGYSNTTGESNQFFGFRAGRFIANSTENTITNNSIFIGHQTRALANNQTNQIVIGYGSVGLGSNTTVLGNSSTLTTAIYGNTLIGTTTDAGYKLNVIGTSRFSGNSEITGSLTLTGAVTTGGQGYFAQGVWANTYRNLFGAEVYRITLTTNNLLLGATVDSGYRLDVSGSTRIRGYANTSISSSLLVYGSGSTNPVFTVQGSQGELFSVTDSLSGSLFSVNDISGLPVLEAFSDNTVLLGSYQAPALLTTNKIVLTASGNFTLSSLPTASYDGAFYEYTARSGSNARAGSIMAIWSGSSVNFTETTTLDFGSTTGLNLGVFVSSGNMVLTGSASTTAWTIKTIVRSI
jgi:hypothetical protein